MVFRSFARSHRSEKSVRHQKNKLVEAPAILKTGGTLLVFKIADALCLFERHVNCKGGVESGNNYTLRSTPRHLHTPKKPLSMTV